MTSYTRPLPTPPPISPESFNLTNLTNDNNINNNNNNNNNLNNNNNNFQNQQDNVNSGSNIGLNLVNNSTTNSNNEPIVCNGCKLGLEEASDAVVVSFGERLWHVDCRCAKCHNLVEHDTNLLLLSDGSPVCENCSYICSVCQSPISNEAIVTGDESYHADCFRCRSCTNKIEELIFAKTSQGIWCMACHNERVARSRKHAEAKRTRSNRKEKERQASGSGASTSGSRRNTLADLDMPPPPTTTTPGPNSSNYYDGNTPRGSISSNYTIPSTSTSLSTLSSEPSLNHISSPRRHRAGAPPPTSHQLPPPIPSSSSSSDNSNNRNRNPSYDLPSTNSNPSLTTTSSSTPSSPQQPMRSPLMRTNSPLLGSSSSSGNVRTSSPHSYQSQSDQNNRTPNSPSSNSQFNFPSSPRMGNNTNGGSESGGSRPNTADPNSSNNNLPSLPPRSPRINTNYDSLNSNSNSNSNSHHIPHSLSTTSSNTLTTSSSNSLAGSSSPPPSSRSTNLSLAAPSEKSSSSNKNRRSGFYGSNGKLSAAAGGSSAGSGTDGEGEGGASGGEDNTAVIGGRRSPIPSSSTTAGGSLFSSIGNENIIGGSIPRPFTPPSPLPNSHSNSNTPTIDQQSSFLPELHTSVSFYDPDTLLFLDHVGSEPSSPQNSPPLPSNTTTNTTNTTNNSSSSISSTSTSNNSAPVPRRANSIKPISINQANTVDQIEELVQAEEAAEEEESKRNHGPDSDEEESEGIVGGRRRSLVASRLRESIRKSRDAGEMLDNALIQSTTASGSGIGIGSLSGTGSAGMSMDVDLVEMLLGELDGTKMEMRDLQGKYSAFRRASRSAFEGFSMAREEYDKEVAARKEAESKMDLLKIKLTEQALTLAAVDKEQKTAEALRRQSTELKSSVVGMERHLSQLRAEVELSTAQVEELASIDPEDAEKSAEGTANPAVNHLDIARSLNARLESVKDEHRRQIESLIQQRDNLTREVTELKITRDNYAEETSTLHAKKLSLLDQNSEATRHLESLKEAASRFRAATPVSNSAETSTISHHQYTPSSSSSLLSTHATGTSSATSRSPLAPSRIAAPPSPATIDHHAIESVRRIKPEEQLPSVAKKFKWGKGKSTEVPRSNNNSISTNGNLFNHNSNGSPSSKTPPPGSRSISSNHSNNGGNGGNNGGNGEMRTHGFQQTSILRPVRCEYCGDKMWGLNEVRCTTCGCYSHAKCAGYLQGFCNTHTGHGSHEETISGNPNGLVMFGTDLTIQSRVEDRQVPIVVSKCIAAVETYGMNYEGIYRKTGGTGQVRLITQYFERGQDFDLEDLDKFNDLAAVTSCMKNFFRTLPDPLFTHELHEEFVSCVEQPEGENRLNSLEVTLYKLPEAHFFTARALMVHLHRIHLRSSENKMTPANLGVVFGPTVLRSITPSREFSDMGFKAKIVELMVEHQPRLFSKPYHSSS